MKDYNATSRYSVCLAREHKPSYEAERRAKFLNIVCLWCYNDPVRKRRINRSLNPFGPTSGAPHGAYPSSLSRDQPPAALFRNGPPPPSSARWIRDARSSQHAPFPHPPGPMHPHFRPPPGSGGPPPHFARASPTTPMPPPSRSWWSASWRASPSWSSRRLSSASASASPPATQGRSTCGKARSSR